MKKQRKFRSSHPKVFFKKGKKRLRPATLLKKRLWHRSFPVKFSKFLRTTFLTEHLSCCLLKFNKTEPGNSMTKRTYNYMCLVTTNKYENFSFAHHLCSEGKFIFFSSKRSKMKREFHGKTSDLLHSLKSCLFLVNFVNFTCNNFPYVRNMWIYVVKIWLFLWWKYLWKKRIVFMRMLFWNIFFFSLFNWSKGNRMKSWWSFIELSSHGSVLLLAAPNAFLLQILTLANVPILYPPCFQGV